MRSICQALNLLTTSIGFMVTGGINSVFQFWIPNNLNNGKLENVYFVIGALSLFAGIGYIFTAQSFVYSDALRDDLQSSAVRALVGAVFMSLQLFVLLTIVSPPPGYVDLSFLWVCVVPTPTQWRLFAAGVSNCIRWKPFEQQ